MKNLFEIESRIKKIKNLIIQKQKIEKFFQSFFGDRILNLNISFEKKEARKKILDSDGSLMNENFKFNAYAYSHLSGMLGELDGRDKNTNQISLEINENIKIKIMLLLKKEIEGEINKIKKDLDQNFNISL